MAGYFTQGRGLAPRPLGSPGLAFDPGATRGALAYPPEQKAQEEPPLKGGLGWGRGGGGKQGSARGRGEGMNKVCVRYKNKKMKGPTLPPPGDRQHLHFGRLAQ